MKKYKVVVLITSTSTNDYNIVQRYKPLLLARGADRVGQIVIWHGFIFSCFPPLPLIEILRFNSYLQKNEESILVTQ